MLQTQISRKTANPLSESYIKNEFIARAEVEISYKIWQRIEAKKWRESKIPKKYWKHRIGTWAGKEKE